MHATKIGDLEGPGGMGAAVQQPTKFGAPEQNNLTATLYPHRKADALFHNDFHCVA
jgi:hypothetical protein